MNKLSENLKKIRKDNNLSQEQLADELNVSRQAISKWESGSAYPEMEKIVQICQKFNLNIDDLLNKDISEIKREEESKNNLNKYMDDILDYITDTINLFTNMHLKSKIKCLFEQVVVSSIIILILLVIGTICSNIMHGVFFNLLPSKIFYGIYGILEGIYLIISLIIGIVVLTHTFKIRYLDYYKDIKEEKINNNKQKEIENEKITIKDKENKIVIRDPKHSEYSFFKGFLKVSVLFIKFIILLIAIAMCFLLICLTMSFILSFTLYKTGLFFIGLLLVTSSSSVMTIIIILLLLNFIFNRKNDKKKMIWSYIISLIVLGISSGLLIIGSLDFNIIDEKNKDIIETKSIEVNMQDNLTIYDDNIIYIEKEIDNIIIEYEINKMYALNYSISNGYEKDLLHYWTYSPNIMKTARYVLKELNNKKIVNVNNDIISIKVYASKTNIEKLKQNKVEYEENINVYNNIIEEYEENIKVYNNIIEEYEKRIEDLENELSKKEEYE